MAKRIAVAIGIAAFLGILVLVSKFTYASGKQEGEEKTRFSCSKQIDGVVLTAQTNQAKADQQITELKAALDKANAEIQKSNAVAEKLIAELAQAKGELDTANSEIYRENHSALGGLITWGPTPEEKLNAANKQ